MEIWKDIQGYEGLYEVSNFGNINSLDRYVMGKGGNLIFQKGIKKKNQPHKEGYLIAYRIDLRFLLSILPGYPV